MNFKLILKVLNLRIKWSQPEEYINSIANKALQIQLRVRINPMEIPFLVA